MKESIRQLSDRSDTLLITYLPKLVMRPLFSTRFAWVQLSIFTERLHLYPLSTRGKRGTTRNRLDRDGADPSRRKLSRIAKKGGRGGDFVCSAAPKPSREHHTSVDAYANSTPSHEQKMQLECSSSETTLLSEPLPRLKADQRTAARPSGPRSANLSHVPLALLCFFRIPPSAIFGRDGSLSRRRL